MNKYILVETDKENYNAGYKALEDIKCILLKKGVETVEIEVTRSTRLPIKYIRYLKSAIIDICNMKKTISKKSTVVIQVPVRFPRYILSIYLWILKRKKDCTLVAYVHDVEQLRYENGYKYVKAETKIYKQLDKIVIHNDKMKQFFLNLGIEEQKLYVLEIFDYLVQGKIEQREVRNIDSIIIAGNLDKNKAGYVYMLGEAIKDLKIKLYGPNYAGCNYKNVYYCGQVSSSKLPDVIAEERELMFGLIWDGNSVEDCVGTIGKYTMYNNPHKLSLYLASGIPVIVWDKAAVSTFVLKNKIGITIHSLCEIQDKIELLTKEEIREMVDNARYIGNRLREGYYTEKVFKQILDNE